jgi:hypothetical protein
LVHNFTCDSIVLPHVHVYISALFQLYSLSDESDRKEFLDKLFAFMQQKNTPISRIPIMAKQPLDLYKLSKLVIERGGLLEVIRRKAWREIAKALDLPASITSAAFTLRTQYLKYLYPYECAMEKLSQPQEIKDAIEGNKRDRRISSDIDLNEFTTSPPTTNNRMEGAVLIRSVENPAVTPTFSSGAVQLVPSQLTALSPSVSAYSIISGPQGAYIPTPHMTVGPHGTPIPLVVTPTPIVRPMIPSTSSGSPPNSGKMVEERPPLMKRHPSPSYSSDSISPPAKKPAPMVFDQKKQSPTSSMHSANITIRPNKPGNLSSTGMGLNLSNMTENSLVVSIDVNGVMYQGVLFAKPSNGSNGNIGAKNP